MYSPWWLIPPFSQVIINYEGSLTSNFLSWWWCTWTIVVHFKACPSSNLTEILIIAATFTEKRTKPVGCPQILFWVVNAVYNFPFHCFRPGILNIRPRQIIMQFAHFHVGWPPISSSLFADPFCVMCDFHSLFDILCAVHLFLICGRKIGGSLFWGKIVCGSPRLKKWWAGESVGKY